VAEGKLIKLFFPVLWTETDFDTVFIYDTVTGEYIDKYVYLYTQTAIEWVS
jgi:hypothetical protein